MDKFAPFVVGVIAIGAAVGWLAPGPSEVAPVAPSGGGSDQAKLEVLQDQWLAGEVVLPRGPDGHFYADVAVDGTSALMLVDTGATAVALTAADAEAIGVAWDENEVRPVARGASGDVYGVRVTLDQVQVGDLEARDVAAIVVTDGLDVSLLGQSFLSKVGRVEVVDDKMVLGG